MPGQQHVDMEWKYRTLEGISNHISYWLPSPILLQSSTIIMFHICISIPLIVGCPVGQEMGSSSPNLLFVIEFRGKGLIRHTCVYTYIYDIYISWHISWVDWACPVRRVQRPAAIYWSAAILKRIMWLWWRTRLPKHFQDPNETLNTWPTPSYAVAFDMAVGTRDYLWAGIWEFVGVFHYIHIIGLEWIISWFNALSSLLCCAVRASPSIVPGR